MKVLVTGSNGFIGKNLVTRLNEIPSIEIVTFDRNDDFSKIENNITDIDFIFHLAGVNRPQTPEEFYSGNSDLTKQIVDLIKDKNIPLLITSSIQAALDNDYGKSKKIAEEYIKENLKQYYIFRLHNVFGKWCKPNYNSVVATFCHNIANGLDIEISDPTKELTLVYIDDVVNEFISILLQKSQPEKIDDFYYVNPKYTVSLQYIADSLRSFKENLHTVNVPNTGNDFVKKLYSTFISYLPLDQLVSPIQSHTDERGAFAEIIRTKESGQFSISYSKPGIVRGNHYHHTKLERFIVLKGSAKISLENILNHSKHSFTVSENKLETVTIPVGHTHNIENIGDGEMILAIWCNELYDQNNPDTFYKEVEK